VTTVSDSDLMAQVRDGRVEHLATLFERHHAKVYHFCLRMTGNRPVSEDLVQDVFMRMLKHRRSFRPGTAFAPWMFRIARNASVDYLRRAGRAPAAMEDLPHEAPSPDVPVAERIEQAESVDLLRRALLRLPLDKREVLLLHRFELKTYDEIARALGCSVSAVKVRAHRAMKELRRLYSGLAKEAST